MALRPVCTCEQPRTDKSTLPMLCLAHGTAANTWPPFWPPHGIRHCESCTCSSMSEKNEAT